MRRLAALCLALALLLPHAGTADDSAELLDFARESRGLVKAFAGELQGALRGAIDEGGPVHAIGVCKAEAPEIAGAVPPSSAWTLGRTSHKLRNPDNRPDAWETAVLEDFLARAEAGEALAGMERVERVETGEGQLLRYMKAIPVGEVCLTCHGGKLDPGLAAEIARLYPRDRATGFAAGQLRGAFTITKRRGD